jgi:hypothetical protein
MKLLCTIPSCECSYGYTTDYDRNLVHVTAVVESLTTTNPAQSISFFGEPNRSSEPFGFSRAGPDRPQAATHLDEARRREAVTIDAYFGGRQSTR